ncbi:hypothetical protein ACFSWD_18360 [Paenibacillus xanthanilyticus]
MNYQNSTARLSSVGFVSAGAGGREGLTLNFLLKHGWWMILLVLAVMLGWIAFMIYRFLHADFAP